MCNLRLTPIAKISVNQYAMALRLGSKFLIKNKDANHHS